MVTWSTSVGQFLQRCLGDEDVAMRLLPLFREEPPWATVSVKRDMERSMDWGFIYLSCSLYSLRTTTEGPWDLKQVWAISFGDPSCVWAITKNSRCQASWSGWSLPEGLENLQHPTGKMQTQEKSLGGWTWKSWNAALDIPMASYGIMGVKGHKVAAI
jgi:hypothetical protein